MLQSQLFSKTKKTAPKNETSRNAQLLIKAGFVDKLMAGVYSLNPLGLRVIKKIENIIRQEMNSIGGQEIFLPTLQPSRAWKKTRRWDKMGDILFKIKIDKDKEFALGPTHEEVITPLAKQFIFSYKDLPRFLYQFQNKFRLEKRAKSGLLRGREFIMKDLYSFHTNKKDLDQYYEKAQAAYQKIFKRLGLGKITYLTYASGGAFSRYSHEFQTLTSAGEDTIYLCEKCKVAVNEEIIADQNNRCPQCGNTQLKKEKATETGNIFKLGTKFSQAFDLAYLDKKGKRQFVIMGCYGIGLQRLLAAIVETKSDQQGIVWPPSAAPYLAHLLQLETSEKSVQKQAQELYRLLQKQGIEVLFDDRPDKNPGEKFADADLIGLPYRLVISKKTAEQGKIELKEREDSATRLVSQQELLKILTAAP